MLLNIVLGLFHTNDINETFCRYLTFIEANKAAVILIIIAFIDFLLSRYISQKVKTNYYLE